MFPSASRRLHKGSDPNESQSEDILWKNDEHNPSVASAGILINMRAYCSCDATLSMARIQYQWIYSMLMLKQ